MRSASARSIKKIVLSVDFAFLYNNFCVKSIKFKLEKKQNFVTAKNRQKYFEFRAQSASAKFASASKYTFEKAQNSPVYLYYIQFADLILESLYLFI